MQPILAVSLPASVMDPERGRSIVETCWNELYTTFGLRTLDLTMKSTRDAARADDQREKARFMGMAWPWLLGQFITAYLRYNRKGRISVVLPPPLPLSPEERMPRRVAEIFDGSMPYKPHGDALIRQASRNC